MRNPYLTKSRFKLALECVSQLYYTGKKDEYADNTLDDDFLLALAKGGYQVGQLAKHYFSDDPVMEGISIDTLDYDTALRETERRIQLPGRVVISEAAFLFKNLFIRVDLLVKEGNVLNIYEVKAKSYDREDKFLSSRKPAVSSAWMPYLYDVAFQRFVLTNALSGQGFEIKTHLLLVNKNITTDINGLHQFFKVYSDNGKIKVITREGLVRSDLGSQILIAIPTDDICDKIEKDFPVPTDLHDDISFEKFIWRTAEIYANNERAITPLGSKCKSCSFQTDDDKGLRSGLTECWSTATALPKIERAMVTELWNGLAGARSFANELLQAGKYFLHQIEEADIAPSGKPKNTPGLTPHLRRMEQVNRDKNRSTTCYFDSQGLQGEMKTWTFPLHMIDFETSAVAVPFFKGMRPYEGVAFQFSHHIIDQNWNVRHQTQYLSFEPGSFPNFEFVRKLKAALSKDRGSVFRYHNHENTYLNMIYRQLQYRTDAPQDKDDLLSFIDEITHDKGRNHTGSRDMIDMYDLVLKYYYSPLAKGSNSLKQILPAVIADSDFLRQKYGRLRYVR